MGVTLARISINATYSQSSLANTGGTVVESFNDGGNVDATANATKAWSYEADGGTHNASMASNTTLTFTLSALSGPLGTVALAHVLTFCFWNHSATDVVTLGGAPTHPWPPFVNGIVIQPGSFFSFAMPATGLPVTSGSADQLQVSTGTVTNPVPVSLKITGY